LIPPAGGANPEELARLEATKTKLSFFKVQQEGGEYHTSTIVASAAGRSGYHIIALGSTMVLISLTQLMLHT